MSAYSALILAANEGLRKPSPGQAISLFDELGLLRPDGREDPFGNLADDITALFHDPAAQAENRRFFAPDSIGIADGVEVGGPDCEYRGRGWSVRIHGNGYLFPWDLNTVRTRVLINTKLVRLRAELERRFGGRFQFPTRRTELRERLIDLGDGWAWFLSESM